MDLARRILGVPDDYLIGITPGSDTGAVEIALWSLLGARGVDVLAWESFGKDWVNDIVNQLQVDNVTVHQAVYGALPDLAAVNFDNDVVLTWNGTTSGVKVPMAWDSRAIVAAAPILMRRLQLAGGGLASVDRHKASSKDGTPHGCR